MQIRYEVPLSHDEEEENWWRERKKKEREKRKERKKKRGERKKKKKEEKYKLFKSSHSQKKNFVTNPHCIAGICNGKAKTKA